MSWRDYARLIRNGGGSTEEWEAAEANNPNDPVAALKVAILQTVIDSNMQMLENLCAAVVDLARQAAEAADDKDEDDEVNPWLLHGEELERTIARVKAGWPV